MKTSKKMLALVLALTLLVGTAIGGTAAWLISKTDPVVNTFTVGKLGITLDEADTDEYGVAIEDAVRVKANKYKLLPGQRYVKDPTVHVQPGSEDSYVFVVVDNQLANAIDSNSTGTVLDIEQQIQKNQWKSFTAQYKGQETTVYWKAVAATGDNTVDLPVFDSFQLRGGLTNAQIEEAAKTKITITAFACQQYGFEDAAAAWNENFAK